MYILYMYNQIYYLNNKQKYRDYYLKNKEKIKKYMDQYRVLKEYEIKRYTRNYYIENIEKWKYGYNLNKNKPNIKLNIDYGKYIINFY
jgi:hypothetical protein